MLEFGEHGFDRATTRRIAEAAGVTLPAIAYHFGSKQGVYLACAEAIIDSYQRQFATIPAAIVAATRPGADSDACRALLRRLLRQLAQLFAGSDAALNWAGFVSRELHDQGPAFALLYEQLWRPGVRLLARLIAGIRGGGPATEAETVDALLLLSSLVAFYSGRAVSLRTLGWRQIGPQQLQALYAAADRLANGVASQRQG